MIAAQELPPQPALTVTRNIETPILDGVYIDTSGLTSQLHSESEATREIAVGQEPVVEAKDNRAIKKAADILCNIALANTGAHIVLTPKPLTLNKPGRVSWSNGAGKFERVIDKTCPAVKVDINPGTSRAATKSKDFNKDLSRIAKDHHATRRDAIDSYRNNTGDPDLRTDIAHALDGDGKVKGSVTIHINEPSNQGDGPQITVG